MSVYDLATGCRSIDDDALLTDLRVTLHRRQISILIQDSVHGIQNMRQEMLGLVGAEMLVDARKESQDRHDGCRPVCLGHVSFVQRFYILFEKGERTPENMLEWDAGRWMMRWRAR
jgi:hypothetical protein